MIGLTSSVFHYTVRSVWTRNIFTIKKKNYLSIKNHYCHFTNTTNFRSRQLLHHLLTMSGCDKHDSHNMLCVSFTENVFPVASHRQVVTIQCYFTAPSTAAIMQCLSAADEWMGIEHWWNDNDLGTTEVQGKNLLQCPSVHHKSHTDWSWIIHDMDKPFNEELLKSASTRFVIKFVPKVSFIHFFFFCHEMVVTTTSSWNLLMAPWKCRPCHYTSPLLNADIIHTATQDLCYRCSYIGINTISWYIMFQPVQ